MYPEIFWRVQEADKGTTDVYGEGFILTGISGGKAVEYFILADDPRMDNWIHTVAIQLDEQVQE